jgi:hypothetical protein
MLASETVESARPAGDPAAPWRWRRFVTARREVLFLALLAGVLTGALFLAERRLDFYVAEEGYVWYGTIQAAHGGVPLRDFFSYDPGRYYWGAAWAQVLGDGVLACRLSAALFQALGLFCGLLAARRAVPRRSWLVAVGVLLVLWMVPRNKVFEPAIMMIAIYAGVALVEEPSPRRHLWAGALVGLAVFFGKNHGLYLFLAFSLLLFLVHLAGGGGAGWRHLAGRLLTWAGGIALGLAPLFAMLLFVPGFFAAYLDSIRFYWFQGRTNFPLRVPWPWRAAAAPDLAARVQAMSIGLGFLLLPLVCLAALGLALATRRADLPRRALAAACGAVGLLYLHHAFSRPDFFHLAPASPSMLLGLVALLAALPAGGPRRAALAVLVPGLALLTFFVAVRDRPLYDDWTTRGTPEQMVACDVAGDELLLPPKLAALLRSVRRVVAERLAPGDSILLAPDLPGLYPVLGRQSPVWDVYPIWPARRGGLDERMRREIEVHDVRWALLHHSTIDRRRSLRFAATHPLVWDHLVTHFEVVPIEHPALRKFLLLHRRDVPLPPGPAADAARQLLEAIEDRALAPTAPAASAAPRGPCRHRRRSAPSR